MLPPSNTRYHHQPLRIFISFSIIATSTCNKLLTLVRLALLPEFAVSFDRRLATILVQVLVTHDFTADELVFEVRTSERQHQSYRVHTWRIEHTG